MRRCLLLGCFALGWLGILLTSACPGSGTIDPCASGVCDGAVTGDGPGKKDGWVVPATCGNSKTEGTEECDDGNQINTDLCLNTCRWASCGDGYIKAGVEECDDGNTDETDACSSCKSLDFQVNTLTTGDQRYPAVAVRSDGVVLVVWQDGSQAASDTSGTAVRLRRFDLKGKALDAAELVAPTTTSQDQRDPDLAVNAQGQALVAFTDWSGTGGGGPTNVRARLLGASGFSGSDFMVNSTTTGPQAAPAVAAHSDGSFWVAFNDTSIGGSSHGTDIRIRRVSGSGAPVGSDFRANTTDQGDQIWPDLAMAPSGNMMVVWRCFSGSSVIGDSFGIAYRLFSSSGSAQSSKELRVNAQSLGNEDYPQVAAGASGLVVAWDIAKTNDTDLRLRFFDAQGTPQGSDLAPYTGSAADRSRPAVAASGQLSAVVWEDQSLSSGGNGLDIRGRRYSGQTAADAQDQAIGTTVSLDQARPAAALTASGLLVVVWESTDSSKDKSGYGIRMRILSAK